MASPADSLYIFRMPLAPHHAACFVTLCLLGTVSVGVAQTRAATALVDTLRGTHAAAVLLDVPSGGVLARAGDIDEAVTPGSTVKPFVLKAALDANINQPSTTVTCTGTLQVKGHSLACAHPRALRIVDGSLALAFSCNAYFAATALRLPPELLMRRLQSYGLHVRNVAVVPDDRVLLALGLEGVEASPKQLANAYRTLAEQMMTDSVSSTVIRQALFESVDTGMARGARTSGVQLAGKTGTAYDSASVLGHGWFAGIVYRENRPVQVLVIELPRGNGNDAALLAHAFFVKMGRSG